MKKSIMFITLFSLMFVFSPVFAADEMPVQGMQGMHDMQKQGMQDMQMQQSEPVGKVIRETVVDGYHLSYHLIEMQAQMKGMEGMSHNMQEMGTHHLMVYIKDAEGKSIDSAQTGYLIVAPDGAEQKVMTMAMGGGYGADINLSKPGTYTIKTKSVFGDKKLIDEFTYQIGQ
jgi:hypothetical protein